MERTSSKRYFSDAQNVSRRKQIKKSNKFDIKILSYDTSPISIHLITSNNIASLERKHDRTILLYRNEPFQPIF